MSSNKNQWGRSTGDGATTYTGAQPPETQTEPYLTRSLRLIPFLETVLAAIGMYFLGFADGGVIGWVKLIVFCTAAYLVSYAIYRMAIEKGVPLAAAGSKIAAPLSGLSIAIVGAAFFMVTAPGLTISPVEEMRQAAHLEALGSYVDDRVAAANGAAELVPAVQAITGDLQARTDQETDTGRGPIARMLESLSGRGNGLAAQMTASLAVRQDVLGRIAGLRGAMEATLADETVNIWTRRSSLRAQQGQMLSLLSELDRAVPVSMMRSYASELRSGVLIPNREDASARINQTLSGYADSLTAALSEQTSVVGDPPVFPSRTGALDTFQYAGKFAPVFLFAFIVDFGFGLALWAYTLMTVRVHTPPAPKPPRPRSDFDDLTDLRAIDIARLRNDDGLDSDTHSPPIKPPHRPSNRPNGKARR